MKEELLINQNDQRSNGIDSVKKHIVKYYSKEIPNFEKKINNAFKGIYEQVFEIINDAITNCLYKNKNLYDDFIFDEMKSTSSKHLENLIKKVEVEIKKNNEDKKITEFLIQIKNIEKKDKLWKLIDWAANNHYKINFFSESRDIKRYFIGERKPGMVFPYYFCLFLLAKEKKEIPIEKFVLFSESLEWETLILKGKEGQEKKVKHEVLSSFIDNTKNFKKELVSDESYFTNNPETSIYRNYNGDDERQIYDNQLELNSTTEQNIAGTSILFETIVQNPVEIVTYLLQMYNTNNDVISDPKELMKRISEPYEYYDLNYWIRDRNDKNEIIAAKVILRNKEQIIHAYDYDLSYIFNPSCKSIQCISLDINDEERLKDELEIITDFFVKNYKSYADKIIKEYKLEETFHSPEELIRYKIQNNGMLLPACNGKKILLELKKILGYRITDDFQDLNIYQTKHYKRFVGFLYQKSERPKTRIYIPLEDKLLSNVIGYFDAAWKELGGRILV